MFDPDATKIRFTWPGFCKDDMQDNGGRGAGGKSKGKCKSKEDKGEEAEGEGDCGCGHGHACRNWCAGLQACCVSCAEALDECPRCTCVRARGRCGGLGRACGGCLAGGCTLLGRVFSVVVTLAGCLGMALVGYYLWPQLREGEAGGGGSSKNITM